MEDSVEGRAALLPRGIVGRERGRRRPLTFLGSTRRPIFAPYSMNHIHSFDVGEFARRAFSALC
jgi:hypothetical protein